MFTYPQYFIGLNGPPGAGKDMLAGGIYHDPEFKKNFLIHSIKYAAPLKAAVHTLFGGEYSEEAKDRPSPYGPTWRGLYIGMSEIYAKQVTGNPEIFGEILVQRMKVGKVSEKRPTLWVCSDCGFEAEQNPVIRYLGADNCLYISVQREGHDFANDSRSYIQPVGVSTLRYSNKWPSVPGARADFNYLLSAILLDKGWIS